MGRRVGYWFAQCCVGAATGVAACSAAPADLAAARWVTVVRDANYDIAIDTARIRRDFGRAKHVSHAYYEVWYRTDHKMPRLREGKPFNREVVHSVVQCDSLWYKVLSVDMSIGNDPPISQQRTAPHELDDQPWRRVVRGTAEEIAAHGACHFAGKQYQRGRRE